jgi:serpin B
MIKQLPVSGYWMQCFANAQLSLVDLYIPKFKLEYENEDIKEILIKMGMDIACSSQAQFPHIAAGEKFYISRSIQKSFIQVDEKGTEAAAVTEIGMETTANGDPPPPPGSAVFRADRPFLFVIRENSTGTILFMGKVGNPAE